MENANKKLKMLKTFQVISLIVFFLSIGLWCLMAFNILKTSSAMVVIAGILTTFSLISALCMPWAKKLVMGEYKKASITFLILNVVAFLLLTLDIICLALIFGKLESATEIVFSDYATLLAILQYTLLVVVQIAVATFIGNYVLRFKKSFILFQAVSYVCLLYIDLAVCIISLSLTIKSSGMAFNDATGLLKSVPFWGGLALAVVIWAFLLRTVKKFDGFRRTNTFKENLKEEKQPQVVANPENNNVETTETQNAGVETNTPNTDIKE